jgi:hypothetical protein
MYAHFAFSAYMKQVTIRKVQESSISKARQRARERGVAMNTVLVEALEHGLGVHPETATNGLEQFAGDSDFGPDWDARMAELREVNPADWK